MMMGGGGMIGGFAKMILLIAILVAVLAGALGLTVSDRITDKPMVDAEAGALVAETNWLQQQRQMQVPFIQQQLEAESALEIARIERDRQLLEAQTEIEIAQIEADFENYRAALIEQRQMMLAEQQQAMIAEDRWNQMTTDLAFGVGIILTLTVGAIAIMLVYRMVRPVPQPEPANARRDIWRDPVERRKRIDTLREIDRRERQRVLWQATRPEYSNGHRRPDSERTSSNLISDN